MGSNKGSVLIMSQNRKKQTKQLGNLSNAERMKILNFIDNLRGEKIEKLSATRTLVNAEKIIKKLLKKKGHKKNL